MKPVAILQHSPDAGPGYFGIWLRDQRLDAQLIRVDQGEPVPPTAEAFSGLCLMGGPMSVNDPLPWIAAELDLIRDADARRRPVIGHCLGGQLLARALGGSVRRNPVKEIGWSRTRITDPSLAREWLGIDAQDQPEFFQWHGDTFELPAQGRNFLASDHCPRQAFVVSRDEIAHLGMQFHCEMTPALTRTWAQDPEGRAEIAEERRRNGGPGLTDAEMLDDLDTRTARMNALAAHLYARWARGLDRSA